MASAFFVELGLWITAFFTIACFSWLYRYNKLFKFAEHTLIGSAAGYLLAVGLSNINNISIKGLAAGDFFQIIPIVLGLSLYTRFIPKYNWGVRYGTSYLIVTGAVLSLRAQIVTNITQQIKTTINAVVISDPLTTLNSIIIIVFTLGTLMYFIFTENYSTKVSGYNIISKLGRMGMLTIIAFYIATTVMTRTAFVINRLSFLINDFLRIACTDVIAQGLLKLVTVLVSLIN